jgi:hypothetical protein
MPVAAMSSDLSPVDTYCTSGFPHNRIPAMGELPQVCESFEIIHKQVLE